MKKIILGFMCFILSIGTLFAYNGDEVINEYLFVDISSTGSYIIPTGYDLLVETAIVNLDGVGDAVLTVSDSGNTVYFGGFSDLNTMGEYNLIFRDNLTVYNSGNKSAHITFKGFLFQEGSNIAIGGVGTELTENGGVIPEYEFLRQDELFNFYKMELTALLLLSIIVILKKLTPYSRKIKFRP